MPVPHRLYDETARNQRHTRCYRRLLRDSRHWPIHIGLYQGKEKSCGRNGLNLYARTLASSKFIQDGRKQNKKSLPHDEAGFLNINPATSYFHTPERCSIIGSNRLNFRVRDGNGCDPVDKITGKLLKIKLDI